MASLLWALGTTVAAALQPRKHPAIVEPFAMPPTSVIVPVRSPAPVLAVCVASLVGLKYSDFEILLCAGDDDPEAIIAIESVARAHHRVRTCIAKTSNTANPKIALAEAAIAVARHDLILFTDDNILSSPDRIGSHLRYLNGEIGLVAAPAFGVAPEGFWASVDCAFMNGRFVRLQLAGDLVGLSFVTGKSMLASQRVIELSGGLRATGGTLCEDAELQQRLRNAGYGAVLTHEPVRQPVGRRRFADVWHRHLRWTACRRQHAPSFFLLEAVLSSPVTAVAASIAMADAGFSWQLGALGIFGLLFLAELVFLIRSRCPLGLHFPATWLTRELLVLPLWVAALFARRATWRGRVLPLRR